jgi:hypothetical protein
MHLTPNGCVANLLKMLTTTRVMLRFFVGWRLDEHLNLKKSDAKSRWVAGLLDVIYYF